VPIIRYLWLNYNGAKLVECAADIVEELGAFVGLEHELLLNQTNKVKPLNKAAQILLQHIDYEGTNVETLIHQTGLSAESIGSLLIELELEGLIISNRGGYSLSPA